MSPLRKGQRLTVKEAKFIKAVVSGASLADSAEVAYNPKDRGSAWSIGKEVIRKPRIQQEIALALQMAGLTPDTIAGYLKQGIVKGIESNKATLSDAMRGIDLYAKLTGAYQTQTLEQSTKLTLQRLPTKEIVGELEKRSRITTSLLLDLNT